MKIDKLADDILKLVGGPENVVSAENCMTRVRIAVKDDAKIEDNKLKETEGVMGIVHDRSEYVEVVVGPGKCRQIVDYYNDKGINEVASESAGVQTGADWKENKAAMSQKNQGNPVKRALKTFGSIFVPMIPGIIAAGFCNAFAQIIKFSVPGYADNQFWLLSYMVLMTIYNSMIGFICAWAGYRASKVFGGTPILGGVIGMVTCMPLVAQVPPFGVDAIGNVLGIGSEAAKASGDAMSNILCAGRGGVIAVVLGAWAISKFEKFIRRHIHPNLDIIVTPLASLILISIPYIFIVMPVCGYGSMWIAKGVEVASMNSNMLVRVITGYIGAALFLPLVAMGMHHSLIPIYQIQLSTIGYVSLYPAFCMAGAGQVGACFAIWYKKRKNNIKNDKLEGVIKSSWIPGVLGIGEPLVYGLTIPLGKPFITAGLGAGFGGAFVIAMQCGATVWGPSGLLGSLVMVAGPLNSPFLSILFYLIGWCIAVIGGFLITLPVIKKSDIEEF